MTLSLSDAIGIESFFKVTVGLQSMISNEQLTLLQSAVTEEVNEFIGARELPTDTRTRIMALFILNIKQNSHGKGTIIKESVTDSSWASNVKSSSVWMDRAITILENFDNSPLANLISIEGVQRDDSHISGIVDGGPYRGENYRVG